jgi:hypothetical protein
MIVCGIGAIGAKRMGQMLGKNASLVDIDLWSENLMNSHSSSSFICCVLE